MAFWFHLLLAVAVAAGARSVVLEHDVRNHGGTGGCYSCAQAYPEVVQSTPIGYNSSANVTATDTAWIAMINSAKQNISICAFYMTLTQGANQYPPESGGAKGLAVFNAIVAAAKRNVTVRLVVGVRARVQSLVHGVCS